MEKHLISPKKSKRIALYVIYDKDGILDGFRRYYLQELRKVTDVIVAVVCGILTPESRDELELLADDIYVRENKGLLAGAWIDGIAHVGWDKLYEYDELLMLNDSFFGPFFPLQELFDAAEMSDADFYGAMKVFEESRFHEIQGRPLKHNHFRGSICYFYFIKNRLLHSVEFRSYWSKELNVKELWDTYFFAEWEFYDYVKDAGFKIDAYQSDRLKDTFYDSLTHCMERLIREDHIPFARIRPFCTDMKDQSLQLHYGKDPRMALEYIDKHTSYDANLIWDYILRTRNLSEIHEQLQLEYVVPRDFVEKPYQYGKKIAVILHIFYDDQVERLADYCRNFPVATHFYITTIEKQTKEIIEKAFQTRGLEYECVTRPNVGVAMSTLWVTYASVVTNGEYEYICYFHDKKSPYGLFAIEGEQFGARCYDNLLGSEAIVKNIINLFEENPRLGVLGAPLVYHAYYFSSSYRNWSGNYENTVKLAEKLDLHVNIDPNIMPVAPYGDMFWFRSAALKKAIGHGLTYKDFDVPYAPDFTMMHAMERIYSFAAQDSRYYYAEVINSDDARSDLSNYQYMLYKICDMLVKAGEQPSTFEELKKIIARLTGDPQCQTRVVLKNAIKKHIPRPVWTCFKKVYHIFGGKKWVG